MEVNGRALKRKQTEESGESEESGCGSESVSTSINPMTTYVVLRRFFQLCPLADLRTLRLVCKQWHDDSLKRFKGQVTLDFNSPEAREIGNMELWRWIDREYQKAPDVAKPWRNYRLFLDLSDETWRERSYSQVFWARQGEWLHKLDLRFRLSSPGGVGLLKKIIFEETPNLHELNLKLDEKSRPVMQDHGGVDAAVVKVQPNLKVLGMYIMPAHLFPLTWTTLFAHFPNVQKLRLMNMYAKEHLTPLVDALQGQMSMKQGQLPLNDLLLKFVTPQNESAVKRLFQLPQLKLSSLEIEVGSCEDGERSLLPTILHFQGPTLNTLLVNNFESEHVVVNFAPYEDFPFVAHQLSALSALRLDGNVCTNFHFLRQFPNLSFLALYSDYTRILRETDWASMTSLRLPHVTEFHFASAPTPVDIMNEFVKWMPNVKLLFVKVSGAALRVVFEHWRTIRALAVHSVEEHEDADLIDDQAITGIVEGKEDRLPNITNLQELQKLVVRSSGRISDPSVYNGFLQLPNLDILGVEMSSETSPDALAALNSTFPNCSERISRRQIPMPPPQHSSTN